jgi:hypothetical protein
MKEPDVAARKVGERSEDLVAAAFVKFARLEIKGVEKHVVATPGRASRSPPQELRAGPFRR